MHALQASFEGSEFSLPCGPLDIIRECEKIDTEKRMLALIVTALFVDNRIVRFCRPKCLTSQLGLT